MSAAGFIDIGGDSQGRGLPQYRTHHGRVEVLVPARWRGRFLPAASEVRRTVAEVPGSTRLESNPINTGSAVLFTSVCTDRQDMEHCVMLVSLLAVGPFGPFSALLFWLGDSAVVLECASPRIDIMTKFILFSFFVMCCVAQHYFACFQL